MHKPEGVMLIINDDIGVNRVLSLVHPCIKTLFPRKIGEKDEVVDDTFSKAKAKIEEIIQGERTLLAILLDRVLPDENGIPTKEVGEKLARLIHEQYPNIPLVNVSTTSVYPANPNLRNCAWSQDVRKFFCGEISIHDHLKIQIFQTEGSVPVERNTIGWIEEQVVQDLKAE